ncbi:MAG: cupin domain-containing protein [Pelovirga sp.]
MHTNSQLWVLGHKVTYVETVGDYALLEVSATPQIPGPPPHFHQDSAELFHVVCGQLEVMCEGTWRTLQTGESFTVQQGAAHTFKNATNQETRFVTTWSPRGFEGFFLEFGVPVDEEQAFARSVCPEMIERATAGCEKYGMIITG